MLVVVRGRCGSPIRSHSNDYHNEIDRSETACWLDSIGTEFTFGFFRAVFFFNISTLSIVIIAVDIAVISIVIVIPTMIVHIVIIAMKPILIIFAIAVSIINFFVFFLTVF
ncbi:hypothetical protein ElyMa_004023000 [Elysia marginata]|uniref:G-protein coupled receptors family 1 profile domain-containing protein n=1 Tax=Elysia marginata TaxID=1093978 RepID=A0AAV4G1Z5_9GAST|nr:hypothetical protein ElyMa_004023000 [Elysia marginata]